MSKEAHTVSELKPYCIQEGDLMIPPQWQDQTLNVFRIPATDHGQAASFVIGRDANKGERTLQEYVQAQHRQCAEQMEGFALEKEEYFRTKGWDAAWVEYRWILEHRPLYLRQVFYDLHGAVLICTLTTTPQDMEHHEEAWRQVMSSLVLHHPAAAVEPTRLAEQGH